MTLRAVPSREPDRGSRRRLEDFARVLEATGWAFELLDARWHVVHISEELRLVVGEQDSELLGVGGHVLHTRMLPAWDCMLTTESQERWAQTLLPFIVAADPQALRHVTQEPEWSIGDPQPAEPPAVWSFPLEFLPQHDGIPTKATCVGVALREHGETLGYVLFYGPSLPASLLTLVVRGDEGLIGRMARLVEPRRTQAAILFADVEASAALSRRLPSRAFFDFISALTSAFDREVVARRGIVGKHAGDGVTAFFLVDDAGSPAAAAAAAVETARALERAVEEAAAKVPAAARLLGDGPAGLNAGIHWGAGLYMGQLVTGGRLEVTALGDEVNECARIEQAARGGAMLASKALLEQLDAAEAGRLGLDPSTTVYRTVADLPEAPEKAVRDAGGIPVADVRGREARR